MIGEDFPEGWKLVGYIEDGPVTFAKDETEGVWSDGGWGTGLEPHRTFLTGRTQTIEFSVQEINPEILKLFFGDDFTMPEPELPWHKRFWLNTKRKARRGYDVLRDRLADLLDWVIDLGDSSTD